MSEDSTRAVMERYWSADHNDTSMLAKDVVFTLMDTGEEFHGPGSVRQMLKDFYHGTFEATAEITNQVVADGHAVVEGFVVGKQLADFAGIPARGQDIRMPICVSYDVSGDQIARARVYLGTRVLAS